MDFREASTTPPHAPGEPPRWSDGSHAGGRSRSIKFQISLNDQNCSINLKGYSFITPIIQQRPADDSQHQRDNNEGQRRDDGEPPKVNLTSQTWASIGVEGPNSPKGCSMQRLVGHQRRPLGPPEVSRSQLRRGNSADWK